MISSRSFRICKEFGCDRLTKESYCEEHEHRQQKNNSRRHKDYNASRRNMELHSFYMTSNWKRVREYRLMLDDYLCVVCREDNRMVKADIVHHVKQLEDYPELALSIDNLISICHSHHNQLHARKTSNKWIEIKGK